jgi:hypothetical protein
MQWHAAPLAVLCLGEYHVGARQVNVAPVEPYCLAGPSARVEQEDDQRSQVFIAAIYQAIGFLEGKPSHAVLGLGWSLKEQRRAPLSTRSVAHDCRGRRLCLPIACCIGGTRIELARHAVDGILVDLRKQRDAGMFDNRFQKSLRAAILQIA